MAAEKANANTVPVSTEAQAFLLNTDKTKIVKKQIEQIANPAKVRLTDFTIKVLKHNKNTGKIDTIAQELNKSLLTVRQEVVNKETAKAEQEAKMDAKFNEAKGGEENNNILVLKIKESIKKATDPETVNPILENNKVDITNFKLESKSKAEQLEGTKTKPLMVAALLKEQLGAIGSKPRLYTSEAIRKREMNSAIVINDDGTEVVQPVEEAEKPKIRKPKNSKWKKAFNEVVKKTVEEEKEEPTIASLAREIAPVVEVSGEVSLAEYKRRKTIAEAGEGIANIENLNKNLGENEQISSALADRRNKLVRIVSDLANVDIAEKDLPKVVEDKTEFQSVIDELLNVKEPLSKEEHDKKEEEYNDFFNDPFVLEQLKRQQLEGILYEYNNPETYNKIMEAERIADKQLSERLQEDVAKLSVEQVNNVLNSEVKENENGEIVITKKDADIQAEELFQKNLVANAVEEVIANYKKNQEKPVDYKAAGRAQAEDLFQKNLAANAVEEVIANYKKKQEKPVDYKAAGRAQAEDLFQKNLAASAVEEVVANYKKKQEKPVDYKAAGRSQAEMLLQEFLVANAVEEVTESYKNELKKAKNEEKSKRQKKINEARDRVENIRLVKGAKELAKKINRANQRQEVIDGAHKTAEWLFVNNIKYDAQNFAKMIHENNLKEAGKEQANELYLKLLKEDAMETAKAINFDRLKSLGEQAALDIFNGSKNEKDYVVTDVDARYLVETGLAKKVKLGGNRYNSFSINSKSNYSGSEERYSDMLVSLRDQLKELGLGEESSKEEIKLAA